MPIGVSQFIFELNLGSVMPPAAMCVWVCVRCNFSQSEFREFPHFEHIHTRKRYERNRIEFRDAARDKLKSIKISTRDGTLIRGLIQKLAE